MAQLRQTPLDPNLLKQLQERCEHAGDTATWAEALEYHARAATQADVDPVELGRLHFELGNLYRNHLGRNDRAISHYRAAIDHDPAQRPAIAAARTIFAEADKWDQVARLYALEAESLPKGPKRAAVLADLANVYSERLKNVAAAASALRDAVGASPQDLQIRHALATLLLTSADQARDPGQALSQRREAADVLCEMARRVSDDYALAYAEAALDAVPTHAQALAILETVAPRLDREMLVASRWVAALRHRPNPDQERELRLKLARAYQKAGQLEDGRTCLQPLLNRGDEEAKALVKTLAAPAQEPVSSLFGGDDPFPAASLDLAAELEQLGGRAAESAVEADLGPLHQLDGAPEERTLVDTDLEPLEDDDAPMPEEDITRVAEGPMQTALIDASSVPESRPATTGSGARAGAQPEDDEVEDVTDGELQEVRTSKGVRMPQDPVQHSAARSAAWAGPGPSANAGPDDEDNEPQQSTQPRARLSDPQLEKPRGQRLSAPPPRSRPPEPPEPEDERVVLRRELARRVRFRDRRGAAEAAERLMALGEIDPAAVTALEDHYRMTRDFRRMRDLAMRLARETAATVEARVSRFREAAMLSESKLGDVEGTIEAWRELLTLAPLDEEGYNKLRRILARVSKWDVLCQTLADRAAAETSAHAQADLYREIAAIQRDKRGDPGSAITALEQAAALDPGEAADWVALTDLYQAVGRYQDAAEVLSRRVDATDEPVERIPLLAALAELHEVRLNAPERAYEVSQQLLQIAPRHAESLDRLERIDSQLGRHENLLQVLEAKLSFCPPAERAGLYTRKAEVAFEKLRDAQTAVAAYTSALELVPHDHALWSKASVVFEEAGRSAELTDLMAQAARTSRDPTVRFDLYELVATRQTAAGELDQAIVTREAQLSTRRDLGALSALVELLRQTQRATDLVRRLDELARLSETAAAKELRLERTALFAEQLENPEAAKNELERVLEELSPNDKQVLTLLVDLCRRTGDVPRRARAQEQLLSLTTAPEARVELAEDLVDTYETELEDIESAIRVLEAWIRFDRANPQPYLRIGPLLEKTDRKAQLLTTLDRLAELAITDDEAGEFQRRAARVAEAMEDYDGAWNRLVPRVVDADDAEAEQQLKDLAQKAARGEALAELYVGLARRAQDPFEQKQRWFDAAQTYEQQVGAADKALEAILRAFAQDLDDLELLGHVDRLAEHAAAYPRLTQVYDTLVRRAATGEARVQLLMRHAKLLETRAQNPAGALQRAMVAFRLEPADAETYAEVKRLAQHCGQQEELLGVEELRAGAPISAAERIEALLEACATAYHGLEDGPRATSYLARAVHLAGRDEPLLDTIEASVKRLDAERPPLSTHGLVRALADVYKALAQDCVREAERGALLWKRAARLLEHHLDDPDGAYDCLQESSRAAPGDEALLDDLERLAQAIGRLHALAAHLAHIADGAIDSVTACAALRRLGRLYEGVLGSPLEAADAYAQLVKLSPNDVSASERLRASLRKAGRHQELLIAIDRELALRIEPGERLPLLREMAQTWEHDLGNRFEAIDAWKKVLSIAPNDEAAQAAFDRLRARPAVDERSLLDADLVVLPEDLRPSAAPLINEREPGSGKGPAGEAQGAEAEHEPVQASEDASARAGESDAGSTPSSAANGAPSPSEPDETSELAADGGEGSEPVAARDRMARGSLQAEDDGDEAGTTDAGQRPGEGGNGVHEADHELAAAGFDRVGEMANDTEPPRAESAMVENGRDLEGAATHESSEATDGSSLHAQSARSEEQDLVSAEDQEPDPQDEGATSSRAAGWSPEQRLDHDEEPSDNDLEDIELEDVDDLDALSALVGPADAAPNNTSSIPPPPLSDEEGPAPSPPSSPRSLPPPPPPPRRDG